MYYEKLQNYVTSDYKNHSYDKTKILITKRHASIDYTLRWDNLTIWGTTFMGKEFVRYSKVRVFGKIPSEIPIVENESFEKIDDYFVCKDVGRYEFDISGKKWILDVIFPLSEDKKWTREMYDEYVFGASAIRSGWRYDIYDSMMAEFVMNIINKIEDRSPDIILRTIMANISSENTTEALIEGKWDGNYEGGIAPTEWEYTAEIFRRRMTTNEPIKYGQCWIFAECVTAIMRFLGIASRTIHAKNSHINVSLNFAIDFYGYSNTEKSDGELYYKKIEDLRTFVETGEKDDENHLSDKVYIRRDSIWNFHFWNEIYLPDGWKCLDTSPIISSNDDPHRGKKILGPCLVSNIKDGNEDVFDYNYLSSSVNSPFRLWARTIASVDGQNIFISFVHSLIYPFYPEHSIISRKNSHPLHEKIIMLTTRCKESIDVTNDYKMDIDKIDRLIYKNHPAVFVEVERRLYVDYVTEDENEYTIQQVSLNSRGIPIMATKRKCKTRDIVPILITPTVTFLSFLIISETQTWPQILEIK